MEDVEAASTKYTVIIIPSPTYEENTTKEIRSDNVSSYYCLVV